MAKKKKMTSNRKAALAWLNFSLSHDTHEKVKKAALQEETTVAGLVRRLLRDYVAA